MINNEKGKRGFQPVERKSRRYQRKTPIPEDGKKGLGRPTVYKPEYCQMLIDHRSEGLSFYSFAAVIGVSVDTLYEWIRAFPDFSDARKKAWAAARLFYEKEGMTGKNNPNFNTTMYIFMSKNMAGMKSNPQTEPGED